MTPSTPRRPSMRLGAGAAALAAATLITACGSSASSTSGAAPTAAGTTPATATQSASDGVPTADVTSAIKEDPKLHAELPASSRSSGTLALGTTLAPGTSGLPHVGQLPDGTDVGVDVDLRNAVAKVLGITWQVQNGTFTTIIPGVQNGRFDVGQDNFGVTAAREQVVDFATYLTDGQSFLAGSGSSLTKVTALTDICGQTVATGAGTTFQQILTKGASECTAAGKAPFTAQYLADNAAIILGLQNGKIDLYFGPTLSVEYEAHHIAGTRYLGQISSTPVGFVTAKGSPLAGALSAAVNELISDGAYARIFTKWGLAGSQIAQSQVNPTPNL